MASDATIQATRTEWRELGFFYDLDEEAMEWRLVGSRVGLRRFSTLLANYASNPRRSHLGEHDHFGPYMYLKIMTGSDAGADRNAIYGSPGDLERLALLIERKLSEASPGSRVAICEEYAPESPYSVVLDVREDGFDPAMADPLLPPETR